MRESPARELILTMNEQRFHFRTRRQELNLAEGGT